MPYQLSELVDTSRKPVGNAATSLPDENGADIREGRHCESEATTITLWPVECLESIGI